MRSTINNIFQAWKHWPLWTYLGWHEVRLRYRRSTLGPWWITLSMAIFVTALSVVYGRLFHQNVKSYLPFLFCGYVFWIFLSTVLTESSELFFHMRGYILQIRLPYLIYPLKNLYRNFILLTHNLIVYIPIVFICKIQPSWYLLLIIPGLILLMANLLWASILLGLLGTRFRDIPPMITSFIQIIFFVSPITWMPKMLGKASIIVKFNPITYLLEIVREPLLGQAPTEIAWLMCSIFFIIGASLTACMLSRYQSRIPFWLI